MIFGCKLKKGVGIKILNGYYQRIMLPLLVSALEIVTLGAITVSMAEAALFFNKKHIKCKHDGFLGVMYIHRIYVL